MFCITVWIHSHRSCDDAPLISVHVFWQHAMLVMKAALLLIFRITKKVCHCTSINRFIWLVNISNQKFIKSQAILTFCWCFGLCQSPSSDEEAGTSSCTTRTWHAKKAACKVLIVPRTGRTTTSFFIWWRFLTETKMSTKSKNWLCFDELLTWVV